MKTNKTVLVTGSTGGIGLEISKILAEAGWNLILLNRSPEKAEKQLDELKGSFPDQDFYSYTANLMDLPDVAKAIEKIASNHSEISALYNVAGILTDRRLTSEQGYEGHYAVNVLAPYFITQRLRKQLSAGSTSSRKSVVVNFASSAIMSVKKMAVSELTNPKEIGGLMGAYAKTKLAITIVSEFLNEELSDEGILTHAVDPGPTKTPMTGGGDGMPWIVSLLQPLLFKSPEGQAKKAVSAVDAGVSEGASGIYISEGKRKKAPAVVSNKEIQMELRKLLEDQIAEF